jgi:hypothetical protein
LLRVLPLFIFFLLISAIFGVYLDYAIASALGLVASGLFVVYYLAGNKLYAVYPKIGHTQYGEVLTGGCILTAIYLG